MSDHALHIGPLGPHDWWACQQPERPYDPLLTWFEERCRPCVVALGAAAAHHPDLVLEDPDTGELVRISGAYEQLRHDHNLPAIPTSAPV